MTATFVLAQDVHLGFELGVRLDRARLGQHLTTLDVLALRAAQQDTHVVACLTLVQQLAEHLHARAGRLLRVTDTDDLDLVANLDDATLHTTRNHRTTTRDREHVLDRHQERAVHGTLGLGDVAVQRLGQRHDGRLADLARVAFQRLQSRTLDDRQIVARELILRQQFTNFHLHQLQQLGVVDHVGLVHEHDDVGNTHLAGQQDVLARLRHRAVSRRHHQDRAVHLGSTRDHVLHVVGVSRAVHVCIVALGGLVLDVRGVDRDATGFLFRCIVDLVIALGLTAELLRQHRGNRRRQRRLAMVHVTDGAHVHVRLGPFKLALCHFSVHS